MTPLFHGRAPLVAVPLAAIALLVVARPGISTARPTGTESAHPTDAASSSSGRENDETEDADWMNATRIPVIEDWGAESPPLAGQLSQVDYWEPVQTVVSEPPVDFRAGRANAVQPIDDHESVSNTHADKGVVRWSRPIHAPEPVSVGELIAETTTNPTLVEVPTFGFAVLEPQTAYAASSPSAPVSSVLVDDELGWDESEEPEYSGSLLRRFWGRLPKRSSNSQSRVVAEVNESLELNQLPELIERDGPSPYRGSLLGWAFDRAVAPAISADLDRSHDSVPMAVRDSMATFGPPSDVDREADRLQKQIDVRAGRMLSEQTIANRFPDPVTTSPVTTSPVTTSPVTTSPATTSPATTRGIPDRVIADRGVTDHAIADRGAIDREIADPGIDTSDSLLKRVLRRPADPAATQASPGPTEASVATLPDRVVPDRVADGMSDSLLNRMFGRDEQVAEAEVASEYSPNYSVVGSNVPEVPMDDGARTSAMDWLLGNRDNTVPVSDARNVLPNREVDRSRGVQPSDSVDMIAASGEPENDRSATDLEAGYSDSLVGRMMGRRPGRMSEVEQIAKDMPTSAATAGSSQIAAVDANASPTSSLATSTVPNAGAATPQTPDYSGSLIQRMFGGSNANTETPRLSPKSPSPADIALPADIASPADTGSSGPNVVARSSDQDDPYKDSLIRRMMPRRSASQMPSGESIVSTEQESSTALRVLPASTKSASSVAGNAVAASAPASPNYSDSLVKRVWPGSREDAGSDSTSAATTSVAEAASRPSRIAANDPYSDSLIKRVARSKEPKPKPEWNQWAATSKNPYSDSLIKRMLPGESPATQMVLPGAENGSDAIASSDVSLPPPVVVEPPSSSLLDPAIAGDVPPPSVLETSRDAMVASLRQDTDSPSTSVMSPVSDGSLDLAPPMFDVLVHESNVELNTLESVRLRRKVWDPRTWFAFQRCGCGTDNCGCPLPPGGIGRELVMHAPFEVDTTQPLNQYKLSLDLAYNHEFPNRAEYLWASPILGPATAEVAADYQDVRFMFELGSEWFSVATEIPIRGMNPIVNPNHAGLGDMNITTKTRLLDGDSWQLTQILRTHLNTGSAAMGLGTGHTSMEPGILARYKVDESNYLHGSLKYWVPIGGTPIFSGEVLNTGLAWSFLHIDRDDVALIHVAEVVNWIVADGQQSVPGVGTVSVDGDTIYNFYIGSRLVHDTGSDLGLVEYGVNWGTSLSRTRWYENLFRLEARFSY